MSKIRIIVNEHNGVNYHPHQYEYMCIGCNCTHVFSLKKDGGNHNFNMNLDKPTVIHSLLSNFDKNKICHSFIKDGTIQYLEDCYHSFSGKTIELPEID